MAKASRSVKAEKAREALKLFSLGRQRLRLLVIHHLQAMLDRAQKTIGVLHVVARLGVDPAVVAKLVERRQRVAVAQVRITAAGDQLLGLREELDLADAAAAELDVVPLDRNLAMAAIGVDLPLHRVHVGDGGEVEILSPDERREFVENRLASRDVAGAGTRL